MANVMAPLAALAIALSWSTGVVVAADRGDLGMKCMEQARSLAPRNGESKDRLIENLFNSCLMHGGTIPGR